MAEFKFGRNYVLVVDTITQGNQITIRPPFTIEFDIVRNSLSSANTSSIRIYNLSPDNRNQIRKDVQNYADNRQIELRAGYGDNMPLIFGGSISQAWSVREGQNFITQIESFDGGFAYANAITDASFPGGTSQQAVVDSLVSSLENYGVTRGVVSEIPGTLPRGNSFTGSTIDNLRELTGGAFFIDNGKANVLKDSDAIVGALQVINASTGLLGTPTREQQYVNLDILFEPRIQVAQQIKIESLTDPSLNMVAKVFSVRHKGMISSAVAGDAVTTIGLIPPDFIQVRT